MKYKVGDKVIIKSKKVLRSMAIKDHGKWLNFSYDSFIDPMFKMCGREVTITKVHYNRNGTKCFRVEGMKYNWYSDWFYPNSSAGIVLFGGES